jgi:protein-S-isoprenylcysteine O-methyltransferase Ste14
MERFAVVFIIACWAVAFGFIYLRAALGTKRTVERRVIWWWRIRLLLIPLVVIAIIVVRLLPDLGPKSGVVFWKRSPAEEITADAVSFLGLIVAIWARTVLGGNWSPGVAFKERHELIERGPYRYVRHPLYSGILLLAVGLAIWLGNLTGLTIFVVMFLAFWIRSREEEKLLTRHFPVDYPEYKRRTKALIPFVF